MAVCEHCGLPLKICAALSAYRNAAKHHADGNDQETVAFFAEAQRWYDEYMTEREG